MATFLELVNDVERESGTVSQSQWLTTVVGAAGRQRKIVDWTRQAWEMIQRERPDWTFRRAQFSHALTVGDMSYTAADLGITDFAGWSEATDWWEPFTLYDPALGQGDETALTLVGFREWERSYGRGDPDNVRPNIAAIGYDRALKVGPPPDKAYVLRGWYKRAIQSLALDDDEPYIDEEYHQAIVWRALILEAEDGQDLVAVAARRKQFAELHSALRDAYLDPIEMG